VAASSNNGEHSALLDPIFKPKDRASTPWGEKPEAKPNELLIVQIVPLSIEQCRIFSDALGVTDVEEFINAIDRSGLDTLTERPGDVIDLADYWKSFGRFDSVTTMVEHSINQKLKEIDAYRPDNDTLTFQRARAGAERLAGAESHLRYEHRVMTLIQALRQAHLILRSFLMIGPWLKEMRS
jgi:hypothetical protein